MNRIIEWLVRSYRESSFEYEKKQVDMHRLYRKWYFSRIEEGKKLMKTPNFSPKIHDFLIKMQG
jgi:hypothetical protein